jgi:hypothetical protein
MECVALIGNTALPCSSQRCGNGIDPTTAFTTKLSAIPIRPGAKRSHQSLTEKLDAMRRPISRTRSFTKRA